MGARNVPRAGKAGRAGRDLYGSQPARALTRCPSRTTKQLHLWGSSSAGRASPSQGGGRGFKSLLLHQGFFRFRHWPLAIGGTDVFNKCPPVLLRHGCRPTSEAIPGGLSRSRLLDVGHPSPLRKEFCRFGGASEYTSPLGDMRGARSAKAGSGRRHPGCSGKRLPCTDFFANWH